MTPTKDEFIKKVQALREQASAAGVDLSTAEDLSIAVMNLISLEEHFFFTGAKTGDAGYFDTAQEVRGLRKELLQQLMPEHEGETWCASKHLLAATMRLIEVGNKLQSEGAAAPSSPAGIAKKALAQQTFDRAYKTYAIFWALKLKLVSVAEVKKAKSSFEDLMNQLANCCDE